MPSVVAESRTIGDLVPFTYVPHDKSNPMALLIIQNGDVHIGRRPIHALAVDAVPTCHSPLP